MQPKRTQVVFSSDTKMSIPAEFYFNAEKEGYICHPLQFKTHRDVIPAALNSYTLTTDTCDQQL